MDREDALKFWALVIIAALSLLAYRFFDGPDYGSAAFNFVVKLYLIVFGSMFLLASAGAVLFLYFRFEEWLEKTSDPIYGRKPATQMWPQTEMDVFLLSRDILEHDASHMRIILMDLFDGQFSERPSVLNGPEFYHDGTRIDYEEMLTLIRNRVRSLTPEAFNKIFEQNEEAKQWSKILHDIDSQGATA